MSSHDGLALLTLTKVVRQALTYGDETTKAGGAIVEDATRADHGE